MTLEEAKQSLRDNWKEGIDCPCCKQFVKLQKRTLYSSMARVLILIYKKHFEVGRTEWIDVHQLMRENKINVPDYTKFKFWGMLESKIEKRDDDSNRNGKWRISQKGIDFVLGRSTVPKYFLVYNDGVYGQSNKLVTIQEALGKNFNYQEMMNK